MANICVLLLASVASLAAGNEGPDPPPGRYCGVSGECCRVRQDSCAHRISDTLCYCDEVCVLNRSHDCCPDYFSVCRNESLPRTPQTIMDLHQHRSKRSGDNNVNGAGNMIVNSFGNTILSGNGNRFENSNDNQIVSGNGNTMVRSNNNMIESGNGNNIENGNNNSIRTGNNNSIRNGNGNSILSGNGNRIVDTDGYSIVSGNGLVIVRGNVNGNGVVRRSIGDY